MLLSIVTFILVLSALVLVHESGHFLVARKFGVRAEEFGFGFPPRIFGIYKDGGGNWKSVKGNKKVEDAADTVYSLNWFPLGGFVKLGEDEEGGDDPNHFANKKIWQRVVILMAGVSMNIVLAAVLISAGFMIGLPRAAEDAGGAAIVSNRRIQIVDVLPASPAEQAGLTRGDVVIGVDSHKFIRNDDLQNYVDKNIGKDLTFTIKRGSDEFQSVIAPVAMSETGKGGIGIGIVETGLVRYPFFWAIWEGIKTTVLLFAAIIAAFYNIIKGLLLGQGANVELAGPVGIAVLTGRMAHLGFVYIMQFTAILSINLAIINAFPFPALDGGRLLFLIMEKIKGRPVKREIESIIHNIGFALLMVLVLLVTYKDIAKYGGKFKMLLERIF